jgi:hypothetical protein
MTIRKIVKPISMRLLYEDGTDNDVKFAKPVKTMWVYT